MQGRPSPLQASLPQYNNDRIPAWPPHGVFHPTADYFHNVPGSYLQASVFLLPTAPLPDPLRTWSASELFLPETNIFPGSLLPPANFPRPSHDIPEPLLKNILTKLMLFHTFEFHQK